MTKSCGTVLWAAPHGPRGGDVHDLFTKFLIFRHEVPLVFPGEDWYTKTRTREEVLRSMGYISQVQALDVDDLIFGSEMEQPTSDR